MVQEKKSFEGISYLELWRTAELNNLCNFGRGHHEEPFFEIVLNLDKWLDKEKRSFEGISYLELWQTAELNHLCNFGRRHHEEKFCEIILNFD